MNIRDKIGNFLFNNKYVKYAGFGCQDGMEMNGKIAGVAHYHFNKVEKAGNSLLKPLVKSQEKRWVALGIFAAIPACLGILLQKMGTAMNSRSKNREAAFQLYKKIAEEKLPAYISKNEKVLQEAVAASAEFEQLKVVFAQTHDMTAFDELDRKYDKAEDKAQVLHQIWLIFKDDVPIRDAYFNALAAKGQADVFAARMLNPFSDGGLETEIPEIGQYKQLLKDFDVKQ